MWWINKQDNKPLSMNSPECKENDRFDAQKFGKRFHWFKFSLDKKVNT